MQSNTYSKNLVIVVLSAAASALSFNFPSFSFLIWFSLAPYFVVQSRSRLKEGLFYSFIFGYVFFGVMIFWVGHVTVLGLVFLLGYLALYQVLFFLLGRFFSGRPFRLIALPCLWVAMELLKESIWCGFSWGNLGYSQYTNLYLVQPVDLFGVKFISFLIVAANVLIGDFFSAKKNLARKTVIFSFIMAACVAYSLFKINTLKIADTIDLSVVQPDVAESEKRSDVKKSDILAGLKELSAKTDKDSLAIFPEAAWPALVHDEELRLIEDFSRNIGRDILMGAIGYRNNQFTNSSFLIAKCGCFRGEYQKIKLVPFGEYVPLRKVFSFIEVLNELGDMQRGSEDKIFSWKGKNFGVLICFEDTPPVFAARFAAKSDFLVNITNDEWFHGEPEASQHLAIMAIRAMENRISIARCANTGISGYADFYGRVNKFNRNGKETFCRGAWSFKLPLNKGRSFFNRFPELFSAACLLFLLIFSVIKIRYKSEKILPQRKTID
jgi:apolipoprotein N-acyltransferase